MNWKKINDECPKATIEYLRYEDIITSESKKIRFSTMDTSDSSYFFTTDAGEFFCIGSDEVIRMPDYFDTLGIHVWPEPVEHFDGGYFFVAKILIEKMMCIHFDYKQKWSPWPCAGHYFHNRNSALEEGVKEAFRIREKQLNDEKA